MARRGVNGRLHPSALTQPRYTRLRPPRGKSPQPRRLAKSQAEAQGAYDRRSPYQSRPAMLEAPLPEEDPDRLSRRLASCFDSGARKELKGLLVQYSRHIGPRICNLTR